MPEADRAPSPESVEDAPPWLSEQERDTWLEVSVLVLQLPGLLDAQLQRDADLGLFEYLVMSWLSMATGRRMRMGQLAQLAQGSQSRLSNVVKRLEEQGFVQRMPDPANGRYTLATLTEDGWVKVVNAAPGHVRAVRRYVLDPLSTEQICTLQDICGRLAARIRADVGGHRSGPPLEAPTAQQS